MGEKNKQIMAKSSINSTTLSEPEKQTSLIVNALAPLGSMVEDQINPVAGMAAEIVGGFEEQTSLIANALSPIGSMNEERINQVIGMTAGIEGWLEEHSNLIHDALTFPITTLTDTLEEQMKPVTELALGSMSALEEYKDLSAGISNSIPSLLEPMKPNIDHALGSIERLGEYGDLFAGISGVMPDLLESMKPNIDLALGSIERLGEYGDLFAGISGVMLDLLEPMKPNIDLALESISALEEFKGLSSGISSAMTYVLDERRKQISEILEANWILTDNQSHSRSIAVTDSYERTYDLIEQSDTENPEIDLERVLQLTPDLKARWPVIKQALESHRDRRYLVSIPCLLAQFEGILVDYLVSENLITVEGYKVYKKKHDDMNHKRIEVPGLKFVANLIKNSDLSKIHFLANCVKELVGDERNAVLHGRKLDYDSVDTSAWLIRCIYTLACNIHSNDAWCNLENITNIHKVH